MVIQKRAYLIVLILVFGIFLQLNAQSGQWLNFTTDELAAGLEIEDDLVWYGHRGGLNRIDRNTGQIISYNCANSDIPANYVTLLEIDGQGDKWLVTYDNMLSRFDGLNWEAFDLAPPGHFQFRIEELEVDSEGGLWLLSRTIDTSFSDTKIYTYRIQEHVDNEFITKVEIQHPQPSPLPVLPTFTIDSDGSIWYQDTVGHLKVLRDNGNLDQYDLYSDYSITDIVELPEEGMAAILNHQDAYTLDYHIAHYVDGNWETTRLADIGLEVEHWFYRIHQSLDGTLYCNTVDGVYKISIPSYEWEFFPNDSFDIDGFRFQLMNISEDGHHWYHSSDYYGGSLWEKTESGWHQHKNAANIDIRSNLIETLDLDDRGNIYASSSTNGLSVLKAGVWNNLMHPPIDSALLNYSFDDVHVTKNGTIWIGGHVSGGNEFDLIAINGEDVQIFPAPGRLSKVISDSLGRVWAGVEGEGLARFDGAEWTLWDLNQFYPTFFELSIDRKQQIWVAHYNGILVFNTATEQILNIGLPSDDGYNYVFDFYEDRQGDIWICTQEGLYNYSNGNMHDYGDVYPELNQYVISISQDRYEDDVYWMITGGSGNQLLKFQDGQFNTFDKGISQCCATDILVDEFNNKWLVTSQTGIAVFNEYGINKLGGFNKACVGGEVFLDWNENGEKDSNDAPAAQKKLLALPDSIIMFSSASGVFSFEAERDSMYSVILQIADTESQPTTPVVDEAVGNFDDCYQLKFGVGAHDNQVDGAVSISTPWPRCDSEGTVWVNAKNNLGLGLENVTVFLVVDPFIDYLDAEPAPDQISNDTLFWHLSEVHPFATWQAKVYVQYPSIEETMDDLKFSAAFQVETAEGNLQLLDEEEQRQELRCSYDPNDKSSFSRSVNEDGTVPSNRDIEYLIRFENIGNDTAFLVNIVDTIDSQLDLNTFELVASSHPVLTTISPSRVVQFRFENIDLPYRDLDSIECHGFVRYRIRPHSDLQPPFSVFNRAYIYFDFNPPIITNTVEDVFSKKVISNQFEEELVVDRCVSSPFPNPSSHQFTWSFGNNRIGSTIKIFNAQGRLVAENTLVKPDFTWECVGYPSGMYFFLISGPDPCSGKMVKQ